MIKITAFVFGLFVAGTVSASAGFCSFMTGNERACREEAALVDMVREMNQQAAEEAEERAAQERATRAHEAAVDRRCKPIRTVGADGLARVTYANAACNGGVIAGEK